MSRVGMTGMMEPMPGVPRRGRGGARPGAGRKPGRVHDVSLTVELPLSLLDAVRAAAQEADVSLAEFVRDALEKAVSSKQVVR